MKILGIDPGTRSIGWALYDTAADRLIDHGTVPLHGETADERCDAVPNAMRTLLPPQCDIDLLAVETMFSMSRNSDKPLAVVEYLVRRRARRL